MKIDFLLPDGKEISFGWRYLAFELVLLGSLLTFLFQLLNVTVSGAVLNFIFFAINFAVTIWIFRRLLLEALNHFTKNVLLVLTVTVAGFLVYEGVTISINVLIQLLKPDFINVNDQNIANTFTGNFALMAIGTVFLVPAAEELLIRGAVFGGLYRKSPLAAWLISVCLFSLIHISSFVGRTDPMTLAICFLQYIPAGICLAGSYRLSGSILAPILIHTAVNALGVFALR